MSCFPKLSTFSKTAYFFQFILMYRSINFACDVKKFMFLLVPSLLLCLCLSPTKNFAPGQTNVHTITAYDVNCGVFAQTLLPWKNKNASLFYCWHTYVSIRNVVNTNNIAIEAQQCFLGIAALHILLSKMWNILSSSCMCVFFNWY